VYISLDDLERHTDEKTKGTFGETIATCPSCDKPEALLFRPLTGSRSLTRFGMICRTGCAPLRIFAEIEARMGVRR
jgi:hypothetical protein